jgi:pimeloyl-ACP methyl ester carboxylesterase
MFKKLIAPLGVAVIFSSCANPASAVQRDADQFVQDHPAQVVTFSGKNQTMRFAWNGDPKKRAVLFVHGSPGSWEGWADFLLDPELLKNFQLIAVDRPGYGGSDKGKTETSLERQAEDIFEVLKFNQSHQPAILVGHSFGGPVVAKIAMDHPSEIGGVVFVASSVSPDLEKTKWFQYPASWWPIRVLIPTDLKVCNEEIFPLKSELTKMLPSWSAITAKTVVIQGELDDLVPPANADFLVAHLNPDNLVQVVRVADLNHFIPWKRPDLIRDAIVAVDATVQTKEKQ